MNPIETDSQHRFRTYITDNFHQLKGAYYIDCECILTEDKIVNTLGNYDLLDFLNDGEFRLSEVKFLNATVKANELKISLFHINSRKTLHRTHYLNDNTIPCDWLLISKSYFKDDLLEFEFQFVTGYISFSYDYVDSLLQKPVSDIMKSKKNSNIEITELFMSKAGRHGWDRCFYGSIRRDTDAVGNPVVRGKIRVGDGYICAISSDQWELGWKLNEMVRMVLGYQYIA